MFKHFSEAKSGILVCTVRVCVFKSQFGGSRTAKFDMKEGPAFGVMNGHFSVASKLPYQYNGVLYKTNVSLDFELVNLYQNIARSTNMHPAKEKTLSRTQFPELFLGCRQKRKHLPRKRNVPV